MWWDSLACWDCMSSLNLRIILIEGSIEVSSFETYSLPFVPEGQDDSRAWKWNGTGWDSCCFTGTKREHLGYGSGVSRSPGL